MKDDVGRASFAWTATTGYEHYPPYVNLSFKDGEYRLAVRGVEGRTSGGHPQTGVYVSVALPPEAIEELRDALADTQGGCGMTGEVGLREALLEQAERSLQAVERGDWDMGDIAAIRVALSRTPVPDTEGRDELVALVARLRDEARQEEAAHKMLADAKTARQADRDDAPWTDAGYGWCRAEQTTRWKAADAIEALARKGGA